VNKKGCIDGIVETIGRETFSRCETEHIDFELTEQWLSVLRTRNIYPKDMQEHGFMIDASHLDVKKILNTHHRSHCLGAILQAIPRLLADPKDKSLHILTEEEVGVIHREGLSHGNLNQEGFLAFFRTEEFPCGVLDRQAIRKAAIEFGIVTQKVSAGLSG
jgi:hypothetical protein